MNLIANSEGQDLKKHNIACGIVARKIAEILTKNCDDENARESIIVQSGLAGYLADVGKAEPNFVKFINKRFKERSSDCDHAAEEAKLKAKIWHNQHSWIALDSNIRSNLPATAYAVYHHHPHTRNEIDVSDDEPCPEVESFYNEMLQEYVSIYGEPKRFYKRCGGTNKFTVNHAEFTIVLICLIQADRWISKMGEVLNTCDIDVDGEFCQAFVQWKNSFNEIRMTSVKDGLYPYQQEVIDSIRKSDKNTFIVEGPPGSGKTSIAIGFCNLFDRRKDFFVAPRNTICRSLYETIEEDFERCGLTKTRELVTASTRQASTGDHDKYDATIINIDSVLGAYFHHARCVDLLDFLTQPMVIDEYHELNQSNALLYVTRVFVSARELLGSKTLLISATPLNILLDLKAGNCFVESEIFVIAYPEHLDTSHHFKVLDYFPNNLSLEKTWYRRNTIAVLQKMYSSEMGTIVHSRYDDFDKSRKLKILTDSYGKKASCESEPIYSSPMIESSLNISFKHAVLEAISPESALQSIGRVERFGPSNDDESNVYFAIEDSGTAHANKAISELIYSYDLSKKWKNFLKESVHDKTLKKSEFANLVKEFNKANEDDIKDLIRLNIKESADKVNKVRYKTRSSMAKNNSNSFILSEGGLRGSFGIWAVFFSDNMDSCKIYNLSEFEVDFLKDAREQQGIDALTLQQMVGNRCFKSKVLNQNGEESFISFDYEELFNRKKRIEKVFKAARQQEKAFPMQTTDGNAYAFKYDPDPNIKTNKGILKVGN